MDQIIPNEILLEIVLFSDIPTKGRFKQCNRFLNSGIVFEESREVQRLKRTYQLRRDNKLLKILRDKKVIAKRYSYRIMKNDNILIENIAELIEKGYICSNSIQKNPNLQKDDLVKYPQYFEELTTIYGNPNFRMEDLPFPENERQWFYLSGNPNLTEEVIVKYKDKWSKKIYKNPAMSVQLYFSMNMKFDLTETPGSLLKIITSLYGLIIYSRRLDFYEECLFSRKIEFKDWERKALLKTYARYQETGKFPNQAKGNNTEGVLFGEILENPNKPWIYESITFKTIYGKV